MLELGASGADEGAAEGFEEAGVAEGESGVEAAGVAEGLSGAVLGSETGAVGGINATGGARGTKSKWQGLQALEQAGDTISEPVWSA